MANESQSSPSKLVSDETSWLSVVEAADALGCSRATVKRRCASGELRARKVGKVWIIALRLCPTCGRAIDERSTTT